MISEDDASSQFPSQATNQLPSHALPDEERAAFYHAPVGMAISKMQQGRSATVLAVNDSLCELLGYERAEVLGKGADVFTHPDDVEEDVELHRRLQAGEATRLTRDKRYIRADGTVMWARLSLSLMPISDGTAVLATVHDITEERALAEDLRRQATTDPLTGLGNRSAVMAHLDVLTRQRRHDDDTVALLYLDLDEFKALNDRLGHHVGDKVLRHVGRVLREASREGDLPARIGGDEFLVVYQASSEGGLSMLARRIKEMGFGQVRVDGHSLHLSCCIGIAAIDPETRTGEDLLKAADVALYRAKRNRRSTLGARLDPGEGIEIYNDEIRQQEVDRRRRRLALEDALSEGRVIVRYQPIVRLADGQLVAVEALARLRRRDGGITLPWEFIEIAEESGMIDRLGREVRRHAIADWALLREALPEEVSLSLNVSSRELDDPELLPTLVTELERHHVPAEGLWMEITETSLVRPHPRIDRALAAIRETGIHIATDDFGAGYSSLRYLSTLPVDTIKLDAQYVQSLPHDDHAAAIARAVFTLGNDLGMRTIAEGIEFPDQQAVVEALGGQLGQGLLFGAPMPATRVAEQFGPPGLFT